MISSELKYISNLKTFLFSAILIVVFLSDSIQAGPEDSFPLKPQNYITDRAGMLDNGTKTELDGYLKELEQKTGIQFLVVTVNSLEGETKESFALSLAERWKPGRKGKDDGLILLIAKDDRKYRFETGYGLEKILPDGYLGEVGRRVLVPNMKKGDYSKGITGTVVVLVQKMAGDYNVEIAGLPLKKVKALPGMNYFNDYGTLLFFLILVFVFIIGGIASRARYGTHRWRGGTSPFWLFLLGAMSGRGRGGGGFGGSGSFGGGLGGGFGGGGAGGGW